MKALARQGVVHVPGGWTTPWTRILRACDWLPLLLPVMLLLAAASGQKHLVIDFSDSFRS